MSLHAVNRDDPYVRLATAGYQRDQRGYVLGDVEHGTTKHAFEVTVDTPHQSPIYAPPAGAPQDGGRAARAAGGLGEVVS